MSICAHLDYHRGYCQNVRSTPGHLPVTDISLTGERTWPGIPRENYWFMRHLACYRWAGAVIASRIEAGTAPILDAGAGEGYGSAALAQLKGWGVVAVELDAVTAAHAAATYPFVAHSRANLVALPFRDRAFAAAVSLQVIEHIWNPVAYLRELARCTTGPIVISTPNRLTHSPGLGRGERPANPFHVCEFDAVEFTELLTGALPDRLPTLYGLQHGERVRRWEEQRDSLPTRLLESPDDSDVESFAQTITADDFSITRIDAHGEDPGVHDLIAIW